MPLSGSVRRTLRNATCTNFCLPNSATTRSLQLNIAGGFRFQSYPSFIHNRRTEKAADRVRVQDDAVGRRKDGVGRKKNTRANKDGGQPQILRAPRGWARRDREHRLPNALSQQLKICLAEIKDELLDMPLLRTLRKEDEECMRRPQSSQQLWSSFVASIMPNDRGGNSNSDVVAVTERLQAANSRSRKELLNRIKHEFYDFLFRDRFTPAELKSQQKLADMSFPSEWYPGTRAMKRKIHLHVGPTNSGKTYHALERLRQAKTGLYAGPLRLLAHEIYSRLNAGGYPCALITGEERRRGFRPDGTEITGEVIEQLRSFTVEMLPLNSIVDVAVVDEIQMLADSRRGWAWTQALLGVRAHELHLCGEERTVQLVRDICASVGDEVHVHRYERLSPLRMADKSMKGDLRQLRKGDAVISFTVLGIHAMRQQIERATGRNAAIVYGALPPETRAQQAALFNDPDNDYDFLVASDAVGMGINLAIKRVIFETAHKWNGYRQSRLTVSDIKQIGGRAGRYRVSGQAHDADSTGLVTTLEDFDFATIANGLAGTTQPLRSAYIIPPLNLVERFATYFPPGTPFSYILLRLIETSTIGSHYLMSDPKDYMNIARLSDDIENLSIEDRFTLCALPLGKDTPFTRSLVHTFGHCIVNQDGGNILDMPVLRLEVLDQEPVAQREYLVELEELHSGIVNYLWLSYRFAGIFNTRALAFHIKSLVESKIERTLTLFSLTDESSRRAQAIRRRLLQEHEQELPSPATLTSGLDDSGRNQNNAGHVFDTTEHNTLLSNEDDVSYSHAVEGSFAAANSEEGGDASGAAAADAASSSRAGRTIETTGASHSRAPM